MTDKEKLLEIFRNADLWIQFDSPDYFEVTPEIEGENVGFCFDKGGNLLKLI